MVFEYLMNNAIYELYRRIYELFFPHRVHKENLDLLDSRACLVLM